MNKEIKLKLLNKSNENDDLKDLVIKNLSKKFNVQNTTESLKVINAPIVQKLQ
jgi:hypothetical protein